MVKVFYPNKNGKIEFTKQEIEKLLDEVYNQGYRDGQNHPYWWTSPIWTYPTITTTPYCDINVSNTSDNTDRSYVLSTTTAANSDGEQSISYSITPNDDGIYINVSSH